jgi:hypothetical protein
VFTNQNIVLLFVFLYVMQIMPVGLLELQGFDAGELEFLTAGTLEIDVDDWKGNTEYRNGMVYGISIIHTYMYMLLLCLTFILGPL